MSRHKYRAEVGPGVADTTRDTLMIAAARNGCAALLRAQLRAGAHLLSLPVARGLAVVVGLHAAEVRPSTNPTPKTKGTNA